MIGIVKKLSTTELTRNEFLVYLGAIFIGIMGIPSILKLLADTKPNKRVKKMDKLTTKPKARAFGEGAYGV